MTKEKLEMFDETAAETPDAETLSDDNVVTLDTPVMRGSQTITEITLRKPNAGELRGVLLSELLQMKTDPLIEILPRVTSPTLTKQDVEKMDPADLIQCAQVVTGFLLTRAARAEFHAA